MQQHHDAAAMSQPPALPSHKGRTGGRRGKARMASVALLALTGLGWVSWIILLAGIAASQAKVEGITEADLDAVGRAFAMSWVILVAFLLLLVLLSTLGASSLRRPAALHRGARALLFLLAILITWGGIEANRALSVVNVFEKADDGLSGNAIIQDFLHRTRTWVTGLVMMLLVCSFIALLLLLLDVLAPAARASPDAHQSSMGEAVGGVHKSGDYHGHAPQYAQAQPQAILMAPQTSGAVPQHAPQYAQQGPQYGVQPQQGPQYAAQPQYGQPQYHVGPAVQMQAPPQQQSY